jgi:hypothetical protein
LRAFATTSAGEPGKVVDLGEAVLLPISTARHQHWTSSWGDVADHEIDALERRARDAGLSRRPLLVVQHHPPHPHKSAALQRIDGMRAHQKLLGLLSRRPGLQVLHGHLHRAVSNVLEAGGLLRVFGAPAVVGEPDPIVRFYESREGTIVPA